MSDQNEIRDFAAEVDMLRKALANAIAAHNAEAETTIRVRLIKLGERA